jgi:hypothetical protein
MSTTIFTYSTSDTDVDGNYYVGSDRITAVHSYDASQEGWKRDYEGTINPFVNHDFTFTTITGSPLGNERRWYETGTDYADILKTDGSRYIKLGTLPYDFRNDVLSKATLLESTPSLVESAESINTDYFVDGDATTVKASQNKNRFPKNYDTYFFFGGPTHNTALWVTSSGVTNDAFCSWTLQEPTYISSFYIDSFERIDFDTTNDQEIYDRSVGYYEIQVTSSGTGLVPEEYTTVYSENTELHVDSPLRTLPSPVLAKHVKIVFRSKSNITTGACLNKVQIYSKDVVDKGVAFLVHSRYGFGGTFNINQDVDLTGSDRLYFNLVNFHSSVQLNTPKIFIGGDLIRNFNTLPDRAFDQTAYSYQNVTRWGASIDVSTYTGVHTFTVQRASSASGGKSNLYLLLGDVSNIPPWYQEKFSDTRGSLSKFPDQCSIVADTKGLSIIENGTNEDRLWMRFELGQHKMLQLLPRVIKSKEGVIYLGTSNGVLTIDFNENRAFCLDNTGLRERTGITKRNDNAFDRWNIASYNTQQYESRCNYSMYAFNRYSDTPELSSSCIDDLHVGYDETYGHFIILATPTGIVVHKGKIGDSSASIFYSKSKFPVSNIFYGGKKIWYVQGKGPAARLRYINSINDIVSTDFIDGGEINSFIEISDDLSSFDSEVWNKYNRDRNITITNSSGVLTISGTHIQGGKTGIETKSLLPDRSFEASAKIKIKKFPPNARGGLRFGYAFDHAGDGILSGFSLDEKPARQGIYMSAYNVDPHGDLVPESATMSGVGQPLGQGWMYVQPNIGGDAGSQYPLPAEPTDKGFRFFLDKYSVGTTSSNEFGWAAYIPRLNQTFSFPKRNFSIRAKVQLSEGHEPTVAGWIGNAATYLGISSHEQLIPNTQGSFASNSYMISKGLFAGGNTTLSGSNILYTIGGADRTGHPAGVSFLPGTVAASPEENTGDETSPYRDWRIDYDKDRDEVSAYVDGQFIGASALVTSPTDNLIGVVFGTTTRRASSTGNPDTVVYIKDVEVYLPELDSSSSNRYGVEIADTGGIITHVFYPLPTFSGIHLSPDSTPSSSTLSYIPSLWDGDISTFSLIPSQDYSFGVELSSPQQIDVLRIYDVASGTSGWQNTARKELQLWYSDDNTIWNKYKDFNLNNEDRIEGVTDIKLVPSLNASYFKFTATDSSYLVGGNTALSITEIQPLMASGIQFYGDDGTSLADFREWKLSYDSYTKEVVGYIDGVVISKGVAPTFNNPGKFVISHDLTVVSSGTHSDFDVDIKDFNLTYSSDPALGEGSLSNITVSYPTLSGTSENYTIVSTTSSGLYILDRDYNQDTEVPDRQLYLTGDVGVKGQYENASVTLFENGLQRGEGLIFVGTNSSKRNVPDIEIISTRPYWLDKNADQAGQTVRMKYGNRGSLIYMPNINKYLVQLDDNAAYLLTLDIRTGECAQIQLFSWLETHGRGSNDFSLSGITGYYVNRLSTVWHWGRRLKLAELDPITSQVAGVNILEETDQSGSNYKFSSYSIHNNSFYFGRNDIRAANVLTKEQVVPGRHQISNLTNSQSKLLAMAWGTEDYGTADATYCDFDRHIYLLGKDTTDWAAGDSYFIKYNPDTNYAEVLNLFSNSTTDWPYSDKDVEISPASNPDTSRLAYCPLDRKIYHIAERGPRPVLKTFDVVSQTWEETGSPPPYISAKEWPSAIFLNAGSSGGTFHAYHSNYLCFSAEEKALVFATANYYSNTDKYFIYTPTIDSSLPSFEYKPSRDGLTTTSGNHFHIPSNTFDVSPYIGDGSRIRNYDFQGSWGNLTVPHHSSYDEPGGITVFSGTASTAAGNFSATGGSTGVVEGITSRRSLPSVGSFDVDFDFSMPSYALNVYCTNPHLNAQSGPPRIEFFISVSDGYGQPWIADSESGYGFESDGVHQIVSARMGVVGTAAFDTSDYDLKAYLRWVDGFNDGVDSTSEYSENRMYGQDTYVSSPVDFGTEFSDFKHGRLTYNYDTDIVEYFVDGVSTGSYRLRRKFDNRYGLYLTAGFSSRTDSDTPTKEWVVKLKNLTFKRTSFDRIENDSLITSVSGSIGDHLHERTDSMLLRTQDWVYECDMHLPTSVRFPGYQYIATLGAMEDDKKMAELVAFVNKFNRKSIGIAGNLDQKHDSDTYLGAVEHQWDNIDFGHYRMEKDTVSGNVEVFVNNQESPSITVNYEDLPSGGAQRMYYGKANYGAWEKIYTEPTKAGTWTQSLILTGYGVAQAVEKMTIDNSAYFAPIDQGSVGKATFTLDENLGEVDVYAFYLSQGYDLSIDTPHIVEASAVVSLPGQRGPGTVIPDIQLNTDENGLYNEFKTMVRVDQTRDHLGTVSSTSSAQAQTSGWVHLGRYENPTSVIVTASGTVGTASTIGFVSVDAMGIDIGKYGRSTFDMSVRQVRYNIGSTSFEVPSSENNSGLTVIDATDGKVIATYGRDTVVELKDGDITSGSKIG